MALAKLKTLYVGIGYPEQWEDYFRSGHRPGRTLWAIFGASRTATIAARWPGSEGLSDMKEWWIAPQTVGAVLVFQQNAHDFTAALLQAPKYDATASDAASYGAIGAIIGHDVTHYVDVLGAGIRARPVRCGAGGQPRTRRRYESLAEPLVKQFSSYRPFPDAAVDGKLTLRRTSPILPASLRRSTRIASRSASERLTGAMSGSRTGSFSSRSLRPGARR